MLCLKSEFYGVANRRQDGDETWRLSSEGTAVPVLLQLYIHGVEMTIGVVDAHVPYSLMTVLRGVVEVEAEVEAVIHGQRHVVGPFIDITVGTDATEAQVGVREASLRAKSKGFIPILPSVSYTIKF